MPSLVQRLKLPVRVPSVRLQHVKQHQMKKQERNMCCEFISYV